eukprot:gene8122-biopygen5018
MFLMSGSFLGSAGSRRPAAAAARAPAGADSTAADWGVVHADEDADVRLARKILLRGGRRHSSGDWDGRQHSSGDGDGRQHSSDNLNGRQHGSDDRPRAPVFCLAALATSARANGVNSLDF